MMSQIFLSILGLALLTWVAKYLFVLYYYRKKKEEINKLEARAAVLRMLLKAKLKRKGSQMQETYRDEKEFLESISAKLDLLTTFNFNRTSDYDDMIDILTSISEAVDLHTVRKNPALYAAQQAAIAKDRELLLAQSGIEVAKTDDSGALKSATEIESKKRAEVNAHLPHYDRWSQLLKYDKGNLYIIKEIVDTTKELKIKIELYNSEQENKELLLRVPDLIEVNGFDGLSAIVTRDQELAKSEKGVKKAKKKKDMQDPDLAEIASAGETPSGGENAA